MSSNIFLFFLFSKIFLCCSLLVLLFVDDAAAQKGGAKGAMRGRGKGGKGRGGGGSRAGGYQEAGDFTSPEFGGGYGGKGRPCIGLCYLR